MKKILLLIPILALLAAGCSSTAQTDQTPSGTSVQTNTNTSTTPSSGY